MKQLSQLIYSFRFALVKLFYAIDRKIRARPKLEVKIIATKKNYAKKRWLSVKGGGNATPIFVYENCWVYEVNIHNSSKYDAYYPRLHFDRAMPYFSNLGVLNYYIPIRAAETIVLLGEFIAYKESTEKDNAIPAGIPKELYNVHLLIEYQNHDKDTFYTVFDFKYQRNLFTRFKPSCFD